LNEDLADLKHYPRISVIIAAFSMDRWSDLIDAVASVRAQSVRELEVIVVIDHNPELLIRAAKELQAVTVIANAGSRGASGARNTGVAASRGEILAFLDDDAAASPEWLDMMLRHFQDPEVAGVGGRPEPQWETRRPRWFPPEFDWVVGCSYRGMSESAAPVRNVWSCNMAIRRQAFDAVGGFRNDFGKVGIRSRPEDTDLCLRVSEHNDGGMWIYEPAAVVIHKVPAKRATFRYFLKRCYYEGQGKAALASLNGSDKSISAERTYVRRMLTNGVACGLRETARGEASGMVRCLVIMAGLASAAVGFVLVAPSQG
jgi:GT2 family glycosyltransferase